MNIPEFRVWNKRDKKMYYLNNEIEHIISKRTYDDIIMQYTGLRDRKGNKIYSMDIIQYLVFATGSPFMYVCYESHKGAYVIKNNDIDYPLHADSNNVQVIGNIYETPELLPWRQYGNKYYN